MPKCFIIRGCIECPYLSGYYFARCLKTGNRLDNVKFNEWEYEYETDKLDYPDWCPLLEGKDFRKEVKHFALSMEKLLSENDEKGGWQNDGATYFADKIYQHAKELNLAAYQENYRTALKHAIHIANYCMMYHDNYFKWRL